MTCALMQRIFHFHFARCTDFVVQNEWPPNSPDFNSLDCSVCGAMLQTFYKLIRVNACALADVEHFEHQM